MPINQPVGADSFAGSAKAAARELDGKAPPGGSGGARSSMTQGAKIKEIVQPDGGETAS
jgi:hypothetical protein